VPNRGELGEKILHDPIGQSTAGISIAGKGAFPARKNQAFVHLLGQFSRGPVDPFGGHKGQVILVHLFPFPEPRKNDAVQV